MKNYIMVSIAALILLKYVGASAAAYLIIGQVMFDFFFDNKKA